MRTEIIIATDIAHAQTQAPWAADIIKVDGGYIAADVAITSEVRASMRWFASPEFHFAVDSAEGWEEMNISPEALIEVRVDDNGKWRELRQ